MHSFRIIPCMHKVSWGIYSPFIHSIMKTRLFKFIENLTTKKGKYSDKKFWYFHISAQTIDCWYSLELPWWGSSTEYSQSMFFSKIRKIMYTPVNHSFTTLIWGLRGSKLYTVLALNVKIRKPQDFLAPISGSPMIKFFHSLSEIQPQYS